MLNSPIFQADSTPHVFNHDVTFTGNVTIEGNLNFGDAGTDILTVAGYIQGSASGNTSVNIGSGTPGKITASTNDLYVTGELETDSNVFFDGPAVVQASNAYFGNNPNIFTIITRQTSQTVDCGMFLVGSSGHYVILAEYADRTYNFGHANTTDPTIFIHSANQSQTEYLSLSHNQTDGLIEVGTGSLYLKGGLKYETTAVNAATYSTASTDNIIMVDYSVTGTCTITLRTADLLDGKIYHIVDTGRNAGTNTITIDTQGAELINGGASITITVDGNGWTVFSNGTNWFAF